VSRSVRVGARARELKVRSLVSMLPWVASGREHALYLAPRGVCAKSSDGNPHLLQIEHWAHSPALTWPREVRPLYRSQRSRPEDPCSYGYRQPCAPWIRLGILFAAISKVLLGRLWQPCSISHARFESRASEDFKEYSQQFRRSLRAEWQKFLQQCSQQVGKAMTSSSAVLISHGENSRSDLWWLYLSMTAT
jgi:hypothetical protein